MGLGPTSSLAAASLVFYLILVPLLFACTWWHGKPGLLGWIFLSAFATLQIAAGCILVSENGNPSLAGSLVTSIGLSPLLLATQGILHEVQTTLALKNKRTTLPIYIFTHLLVGSGVALLAVGATGVFSAASANPATAPKSSDLSLWKVGAVLLLLSWIVTSLVSMITLFDMRAYGGYVSNEIGMLLWAIILSLPFTGIRTLYGLIYAVTQRSDLSAVAGTMSVKVLLIFLPQLGATAMLVAGGIRSRGLRRKANGTGEEYGLPMGTRREGS